MTTCDCLSCRLYHIATTTADDEAHALACLGIALGALLAPHGEKTFGMMVSEIRRYRDAYRGRPNADAIGEVSGHA